MGSIRFLTLSGVLGLATFANLASNSLNSSNTAPAKLTTQPTLDSVVPLPPIPKVKDPADDIGVIQEAYEFVGRHPEIARYVPCFCACSRRRHHQSINDCFVKSRGKSGGSVHWDKHAAECYICISVAEEARRSYLSGMSLVAIRAHIEKDLAPKFKFHTETPEPPAQQ